MHHFHAFVCFLRLLVIFLYISYVSFAQLPSHVMPLYGKGSSYIHLYLAFNTHYIEREKNAISFVQWNDFDSLVIHNDTNRIDVEIYKQFSTHNKTKIWKYLEKCEREQNINWTMLSTMNWQTNGNRTDYGQCLI